MHLHVRLVSITYYCTTSHQSMQNQQSRLWSSRSFGIMARYTILCVFNHQIQTDNSSNCLVLYSSMDGQMNTIQCIGNITSANRVHLLWVGVPRVWDNGLMRERVSPGGCMYRGKHPKGTSKNIQKETVRTSKGTWRRWRNLVDQHRTWSTLS
jgi:hypothetical protein